jgi:hypothetical protein
MTAAAQPGSDHELGPVDFLAIEFPAGRLTASGFEQLLSLADRGVVEILDMEFIVKDADGKSKKVDVWEFAVPDGVDLTAWAGASSGLLDDSDVGEISAAMQPGSVAAVVIYENRWVLGLVDAWRRGSRPRSGVNKTTGVGSPSRATNSSKEGTYTRACSSIAYRPYPPPHRRAVRC